GWPPILSGRDPRRQADTLIQIPVALKALDRDGYVIRDLRLTGRIRGEIHIMAGRVFAGRIGPRPVLRPRPFAPIQGGRDGRRLGGVAQDRAFGGRPRRIGMAWAAPMTAWRPAVRGGLEPDLWLVDAGLPNLRQGLVVSAAEVALRPSV